MDEARFLAQALRYRAEECRHIVAGFLEYLFHAPEVALGQLDFRDGLAGHDAYLRPGIADSNLHVQPLVEFIIFRPHPFHLGARIALNHLPSPCRSRRYCS